eukprot:gene6252-11663_t
MACKQDDVLLALAYRNRLIALNLLEKGKRKRSSWVRELWKYREQQGHFDNLVQEMRLNDHSMHFNFFRMLPSTFDDLLKLVGPALLKKKSRFREPLSPALRLAVTLRARRVVENAFGILSARWRFLRAPIQAQPEKASKSILAAIALHNWLKKHDDSQKAYGRIYCPPGYIDYEDAHGILHRGTWRSEVTESGSLSDIKQLGSNNHSRSAQAFRQKVADYFQSAQVRIALAV